MRKNYFFFKSLLLATVLMLGSANAWGDVIYPSATKITSGVSTPTGSAATSWIVSQIQASGTNSYKGNGPCVCANFDLTSALSGKELVSAYLKFSMTANAYNSSINIFVNNFPENWDASTAYWGSFSFNRTGTVTSGSDWTTKNKTTNHSYDVTSIVDGDVDKIVGFILGVNTAREQTLSNLTLEITATDPSSVTTYSIEKYEVGGGLISSVSDLAGVVGETSSVSESDKNIFYLNNKKYVYDSTNEYNVESMELTSTVATNVLKLYFNAYTKYTAKIESVCGENEIDDITGTWYADESPVTLYYPKVVNCSDGYYVVDANGTEPHYGHLFSSSDLTHTVTYTLDESIVYYAEYEDILTDKNTYEYFAGKSSKGTSRCIKGSGVMKTNMARPSDGLYDVTISGGNRDGGHTTTMDLKLIDSGDNISAENIISQYFTGGQWIGEMTARSVAIPAGSELYIANDNGTGNAKFAGDYIIVRSTPATVPITISDAGFATLYSAYALDFEHATAGLEAYTATLDGVTVDLKKVDNVPAETGVVLKADAGTYNIPVIASSATAKGSLEGNVSAATAWNAFAGDNLDIYGLALSKEEAGKVEFAKITDGSVAPGKAFLKVSNTLAKSLRVIIDGQTTDVTAPEVAETEEPEVLVNLAGIPVGKDYKGIVINQKGEKRLQK